MTGAGPEHCVGFVRNGLELGGASLQEYFNDGTIDFVAPFSQAVSLTPITRGLFEVRCRQR